MSETGEYKIEFQNAILAGSNLNNVLDSSLAGDIHITLPSSIHHGSKSKTELKDPSLYPNPVNSSTHIKYYAESVNPFQVHITNILGQNVLEFSILPESYGWNTIFLNLDQLSSGIYFIHLQMPEQLKIIKAFVQK